MDNTVVGRFHSKKGEVIFRYPRFEDWEGMLDGINSLVAERDYIVRQQKKQKKNSKNKWYA